MSLTAKHIALAAQMACMLEVCAPKPGNVNRQHDFSDLHFEDFLLSALAIGPAIEHAGKCSVGQTIWHAIRDTQRLVHTNTNLGIVLLLAPLASTLARLPGNTARLSSEQAISQLRENLPATLSGLTVEDAQLTYAAIRLAQSGALGQVDEADVNAEPEIDLLQAMALAQERDSIAKEYVTGYEITFGIGYPALVNAYHAAGDLTLAIVHAYLTLMARIPDTLIARKRGWGKAVQVSQWAETALAKGGALTPQGQAELTHLDDLLRSDVGHGMNPGTSADLTVAAVFLLKVTGGDEHNVSNL